jgi:hypothetical protein
MYGQRRQHYAVLSISTMKIFVVYGYNERDAWIERDVFPILQALNLEVTDGKDMHGETLQDGVKERIHDAGSSPGT